MQFSVATVLAFAAAVSAMTNVTVTTVTMNEFVTVCPASGTIVHEGQTYTNTLTVSSTITIPCPTGCAVVLTPVSTASSVVCNDCSSSVAAPLYPQNTTVIATQVPAASKTATQVGTTSKAVPAQTSTLQAGAGKAVAFSGASLAGLLGLAAYIL